MEKKRKPMLFEFDLWKHIETIAFGFTSMEDLINPVFFLLHRWKTQTTPNVFRRTSMGTTIKPCLCYVRLWNTHNITNDF